ncbi:MAG: hypothetical protein KGZ25_14880 [Planctomycetes bacterium]|nr:hypothetical protein [Planctomycetota bacterium]
MPRDSCCGRMDDIALQVCLNPVGDVQRADDDHIRARLEDICDACRGKPRYTLTACTRLIRSTRQPVGPAQCRAQRECRKGVVVDYLRPSHSIWAVEGNSECPGQEFA